MSRKRNANGSRLERENKFAAQMGLGTGRTFMGACLSAFESGAQIEMVFRPPDGPAVQYVARRSDLPVFVPLAHVSEAARLPAQEGEK